MNIIHITMIIILLYFIYNNNVIKENFATSSGTLVQLSANKYNKCYSKRRGYNW